MKLSAQTIAILKNFATINANIYIPAGNVVKVRSVIKNVFAEAQIDETFTSPICLYDLGEFLSVINIGADGEIVIKENHLLIKWGKSKMTYNFADTAIMRDAIDASTRVIDMPEADIRFELSADMLASIQKASSILKTQYLSIYSEDGVVAIKTFDKEDVNSNAYQITTDVPTQHNFNMLLGIEFLKLLPGSYDVSISRNNISKWIKEDSNITYHIAMDTASTFE